MDKNAIKKYAVWARRELISRVSQKALQYGITEKDMVDRDADSVNGHLMTAVEKRQRQALVAKIKKENYEQVMEEVAYTWFNRFIALRFMEVNGYLPTHVRIFTDENNDFKPQILTEAIHLELNGLDMEKVYAFKTANQTDELFKYLIITQCNALSAILPGMFQKIKDYTELLFPDNLLREGSVIEQMIALVPDDDWKDAVQIIGWLYQYYNTEPKEKVFANLKKNIKISRESIPAATQLFTPDWIVRYMVENSLGRLWIEGHPNDELKSTWKYYLDEAKQEPEVHAQLEKIREEYKALTPEQIKCIDPCMGSGHILVYMFDVLMQIYEAYGFTVHEAVASVVQNNLYGLDIDDRAAQLAYFAVMMKARQYDRRFFSRGIQPHVYAIQESNNISRDQLIYFGASLSTLERNNALNQIVGLLDTLLDAKEYGSILNVELCDWNLLRRFVAETGGEGQMSLDDVGLQDTKEKLLSLIDVGQTLAQKYDVVVTNPPYMANSGMSGTLSSYVKKYCPEYKADLYAVFIYVCEKLCNHYGKIGMMTSYTWMFLSSFESTRKLVEIENSLSSLIQPEYHAFFEAAYVPICTFIITKGVQDYSGVYIQLKEFYGADIQSEKVLNAISNPSCGYLYISSAKEFSLIEGAPIAYWAGRNLIEAFKNQNIGQIAKPRQGLATGENDRFTRVWYEVVREHISMDSISRKAALDSNKKWFPYNKGGEYRKWYGNNDFIVNWQNDGFEIRNFKDEKGKLKSRPQNMDFYFKPSVTWSKISSGSIAFRYKPNGHIFDVAGTSIFTSDDIRKYMLGFCNSSVALKIAQMLSPTLNYEVGHIANFPFILSLKYKSDVDKIVNSCIELSKKDWDSFETSWDFKVHPLIALRGNYEEADVTLYADDLYNGVVPVEYAPVSPPVSQAYDAWERLCDERFDKLKANEEELNRIFIDIYGLKNELTPEDDDKDVTVRKADLQRDIRSLISYAVGCMFGRYSLDVEGLACAGGEWNAEKYKTYPADADNIIPICDDEYFEDDILGRFVKFVEVVYGKDTLEENLKFIADTLGGKGSPRDIIRNYFLNSFYADHCKIYQKRPIYWLFDSGKKNGFKALIYMHRYQPDSLARMRTDYVHEQQARYRTAIADVEQRINNASTAERVKLNKRLDKLQGQATEIREYEEKIHHLADQMIHIDLDDGVKHNYEMFKDVLAPIK